MPVKLAPSSCTDAAKGLAQETVNAVELESDAQGCVNVKVDVWTMMILRSIRLNLSSVMFIMDDSSDV